MERGCHEADLAWQLGMGGLVKALAGHLNELDEAWWAG
jgi:hypothetical protein